ncbi:hypothetical protein [Streptomyces sp. NPDC051000]|uniref:hypothetical protein n=1 Tax=Streptomyces sp. NPDC051000 TaxID=3155520 RepID=UPI0033E32EA5
MEVLLLRVQDGLGPQAYTPVPTSEERKLTDMERDLRGWLVQARGALGTARQYLSPQGDAGGPAAEGVIAASQALGAVRDTIGSHLGPDRAPLTPYAYLLREQDAFDYLASRYSEVAWAAGQVVHRLAQEADHPGAGAALDRAWRSLDRASVNVRASSPDTDRVFGSFSAALPVRPTPAGPADPTSALTSLLAEDGERLSRAAYEALHDRAEQRLSGTDLQQISRWNAMGRLLAGRTLLHVAADMQDGAVRDGFKSAAAELRAASQAWGTAAQGWEALVDTSHPKEPSRGEAQGLNGKPVSLPTTDPHPAVAIARTSVVRSGQLLFGPQWTPEQQPGAARPAADIVADAGGEGGLAASSYRLSATGWQMAAAAPWVVRRAAAGLVTDSAEHRPAALPSGQQFHPAHPRQIEVLAGTYAAVMGAEQKSAAALLNAAASAGVSVPRAVLDACRPSHNRGKEWVTAQRVQAPLRAPPRAHVPTDLLLGRRGPTGGRTVTSSSFIRQVDCRVRSCWNFGPWISAIEGVGGFAWRRGKEWFCLYLRAAVLARPGLNRLFLIELAGRKVGVAAARAVDKLAELLVLPVLLAALRRHGASLARPTSL